MEPEGRVDLVRLRGFCFYGMNTVCIFEKVSYGGCVLRNALSNDS